MNEHPIIFNQEMVKAVTAGRKTQTRRVVRYKGELVDPGTLVGAVLDEVPAIDSGTEIGKKFVARKCPYGKPGDKLWVRETFSDDPCIDFIAYRADDYIGDENIRWKPSIHMPRGFCRITLLVKTVRLERLQTISRSDAIAEGCPLGEEPLPWFEHLWSTINARRGFGWWVDPWVWVVEFEVEKIAQFAGEA